MPNDVGAAILVCTRHIAAGQYNVSYSTEYLTAILEMVYMVMSPFWYSLYPIYYLIFVVPADQSVDSSIQTSPLQRVSGGPTICP